MNDYARVARVIAYLDEHCAEQPDLAELARQVELSPFYFHRLFSRWAGVTPKDFLQCLTLAHARERLRQGASALEAALEAGLSGPGRLHDLCVHLEAATPGEIKSGGEGCEIRYGFAGTPFGRWLAAETERGICHLAFTEPAETEHALAELREQWPAARLKENSWTARQITERVFSGTGAEQPGPLQALVRGTPFQIKVWRALLQVPAGSLISYGELARVLGQPRAARAVGSAVASNTLAVLIPCHRVIRDTAVCGEYRWGRLRKRSLQAWEFSRAAR